MKRLRLILAGIFLLACAALWIHSYFRFDHLEIYRAPDWEYSLRANRGTVTFRLLRSPTAAPFGWALHTYSGTDAEFYALWAGLDEKAAAYKRNLYVIRWGSGDASFLWLTPGMPFPPPQPYWYVAMPLWVPVSAAACVLLGPLRHRRRKQIAPVACRKCHYDLRAHITGGAGDKCPECGTALPSTPHLAAIESPP